MKRRFDQFGPASFLLTLAMTAWFAPFGFMDFVHESQPFKPALDILDGRMIFRDIFTQYGAVPMLIHAGAMALFGKTMLVTKLVTSVFYGIAAFFFYLTWRKILPASSAFLCVVLWNLLSYHFLHGRRFMRLPSRRLPSTQLLNI